MADFSNTECPIPSPAINWRHECENNTKIWQERCLELRDCAFEYSKMGYPLTASIVPGSKHSRALGSGHDIHNPILNPLKAYKLWSPGGKFYGHNILLIVGRGISMVVDLDCKPGEPRGEDTLAEMERVAIEMGGDPVPRSMVNRTPSDGEHIVLKDTARISGPVEAKKNGNPYGGPAGIDLLKCGGDRAAKHIVLPPSLTFEYDGDPNGHYKKHINGEYTCVAGPVPTSELEDATDWLINEYAKHASRPSIAPDHKPEFAGTGRGTEDTDVFKKMSASHAAYVLSFIPCDSISEDEWVKVGMALKLEFSGEGQDPEDGYELWNTWSATDQDRYTNGECRKQYNRFNNDRQDPVGMGTVVNMAKPYGYKYSNWLLQEEHTAKNPSDERPAVFYDGQDPTGCLDAIEKEIGKTLGVFVVGSKLSAIGKNPGNDQTVSREMSSTDLMETVFGSVSLYGFNTSTKKHRAFPFYDAAINTVVNNLMNRGQRKFIPPLLGISSLPVVRPDFTMATARGYDAATKLYINDTVPVLPAVGALTKEDAAAALEQLKAPFQYYGFGDAEMAAVLSVLLRPFFKGLVRNTPGLNITCGNAGGGKSLLASAIVVLITGSIGRCTKIRHTPSEEEMRKSILAAAMSQPEVLVLDNVARGTELHSEALDEYITEERFGGRKLGVSEMLHPSADGQVVVNGNGVSLKGDTATRFLTIRIELDTDRPTERAFPWSPPEYVKEHRGQLINAAVRTILAWVQAGCPDQIGKSTGRKPSRFKEWDQMVRNTILWASDGRYDPLAPLELSMQDDDEEASVAALFRGVCDLMGLGAWFKSKDLHERLIDTNIEPSPRGDAERATLEDARMAVRTGLLANMPIQSVVGIKEGHQTLSVVVVGVVLKGLGGKVSGGLKLTRNRDTHSKVNVYRVVEMGQK